MIINDDPNPLNLASSVSVTENEGKCPALPNVCSGVDVSTLQGSCRNDADCPTKGQKCCPSQVDGACFKVCQAPRAGKN